MKSVKIVTHGGLPSGCEIVAATATEALEGWSRQLATPVNRVIEVVGFSTEEDLNGALSVDEIHIIPSLFGGGGDFGQFIVAGLLVAVSFIPGIGTALSVGLRIAAGVAALNGVVGLFLKAPTLSQENDPEASKYIGGGENTTQIGTPIGMGGGRMRVGGHYLSIAVDAQEIVLGKYP